MKCGRIAILLMAFFATVTSLGNSTAGQNNMNWIKIRPVGNQDKPPPTVWIAPVRFPIENEGLNQIAVLSPEGYDAVVKFSRRYACRAHDKANLVSSFGMSELSEATDGNSRVLCVLDRDKTCYYLTQIVALPGVRTGVEDLGPIVKLVRRLGC